MFAKYGVEEGGEEQFRTEVRQNMARELKNAVRGKVKQQVMEAVLAAHESVEVPKALMEQEVAAMRNQMFQQFGGAGGPGSGSEVTVAGRDVYGKCRARVKLGLVLAELVSKLNSRQMRTKCGDHRGNGIYLPGS